MVAISEQLFSIPDEATIRMPILYMPDSHSTDELYTGNTEPMPAIYMAQPSISLIVPAQYDVFSRYEQPVYISTRPTKPSIEQASSLRWYLAALFFVATCVFICATLCVYVAVR